MKIALDVDDVLADLLTAWTAKLSRLYQPENENKRWGPDDLTQWEFAADLGLTEAQQMEALTDDLYNDVLPHSGALAVVNALRARGHEPVFISSCYTQNVWPWKVEWLSRFGFMTAKDQAFPVGPWCQWHTKGQVGKEYGIRLLVDDSVKNCSEWNTVAGNALLLTRPHNRNQLYCGKRLKKFEDLLQEVRGWEYQRPVPDLPEPNHTTWPDIRVVADPTVPPDTIIVEQDGKEVARIENLYFDGVEQKQGNFAADSKPTNPKDAIGSDKLPLSLWPLTATVEGSLAMLEGALKYGRGNFRAIGVRASIYIDAANRHLASWMEGEDIAPDSKISHLGHALACLAIVVDAREAGKLTDDRNFPGGYLSMVERLTPEVKRLKEKYQDRSPRHYTINDTEVL